MKATCDEWGSNPRPKNQTNDTTEPQGQQLIED